MGLRDKIGTMIKVNKNISATLALFLYFFVIISPSLIFYLYHSKFTLFLPFIVLFQLAGLYLLAALLRFKVLIFASCYIFFLTAIVQWGHYFIFKSEITDGAFAAIFSTNFSETRELLLSLPGITVHLAVVMALSPFGLFYFSPTKFRPVKAFILTCLFIMVAASAMKLIATRSFEITTQDFFLKAQPLRAIVSFNKAYHLVNDFESQLSSPKMLKLSFTINDGPEEQTNVVIIGETARRKNWQLYGYSRDTNRYLQKHQKNLYIFKDAISAANATILSLFHTLSYSNLDGMVTILDVAKSAGYKTYWLSNQDKFGIFDNPTSVLANRAHQQSFVTSSALGARYDDNVLKDLSRFLSQPDKKKLIIIHLMGSHLDYKRRYPDSFAIYQDAEILKAENYNTDNHQLINEYDNSILYTDYVVAKIVDLIADKNVASSVLYFSDHGETLFERKGFSGHGGLDMRKCEVEVPMVLWLSPKFKQTNTGLLKGVEANLNKEISLNDFFKSYLHLLGVELTLEGKSNFFDPKFKAQERYVYNPNNVKVNYRDLE